MKMIWFEFFIYQIKSWWFDLIWFEKIVMIWFELTKSFSNQFTVNGYASYFSMCIVASILVCDCRLDYKCKVNFRMNLISYQQPQWEPSSCSSIQARSQGGFIGLHVPPFLWTPLFKMNPPPPPHFENNLCHHNILIHKYNCYRPTIVDGGGGGVQNIVGGKGGVRGVQTIVGMEA